MSWYDLISKPLDYTSLSDDCYACAAERIRVALGKGERPNPRDWNQVFGDITRGVSMPVSREELREHFLRNRKTA